MLINNGQRLTNQDLDIHSQEWYTNALEGRESVYLTSSHVQHIISGERPWVITLSRGIRNKEMGTGQEKEGVFFIDLNYSAISELCDQSMVGNQGYALLWMQMEILCIILSSSSFTMSFRQRILTLS